MVLIVLAVMAVAYVLVLRFYSVGGLLDVTTAAPASSGSVTVRVEVLSIDPNQNTATIRLHLGSMPEAFMAADGRLLRDVVMVVSANDGADEYAFPRGSIRTVAESTIGITGETATYPFDEHKALVGIEVLALDGPPGEAVPGGAQRLPVDVMVTDGVNAWDTTARITEVSPGAASVTFTFQRSFSTVFFAVLLIMLALIVALFPFTVGVSVLAGKHQVDSSILGWGAGLLFALVAFRFYLPGDVPIGSGIDVFVYLWIVVLAFLGLAGAMHAWMRDRKTPPRVPATAAVIPGEESTQSTEPTPPSSETKG